MKICMIVPDAKVKGGIAAVVNGYRTYDFGKELQISYVESYRDGSRYQKLLKALKGYGLFLKELFTNRPDVVHIHSSFGPSFYRKLPFIYLSRFFQIPVLNHIHGADFETFYEEAPSLKRKLIQRVYGKCQALIALSEEWKQKLLKIVPKERIFVIENYCRIPEPIEREHKKQILFLGEIGERKGCFDIPKIYAGALRQHKGAKLYLAGEGRLEEVRQCFGKEQAEMGVTFPGWVRGKEKEKLLKESNVFLFPSYHEGMPMAVLEAMAYGLAIITTRVGGIPKLIDDGESGFLCEPGDIEKMTECLCLLLQDQEKCQRMGEAARRKAIECYSMESHVKKLKALYQKLGAD